MKARLVAIVLAVAAVPSGSLAAPPPVALRGLEVSFRLDPRLTRGLYLGERWVSPRTYTSTSAEEGQPLTVEARARAIDANGMASSVRARWTVADPEMIRVTHAREKVQLVVLRPGESRFTVSFGPFTSTFVVRTVAQSQARWRVDVSRAAGGDDGA